MRPSLVHVLNVLAHVIAVMACLAVMIGLISQSASAQTAANNIDWALQETLSRDGTVRAIIQLDLPNNGQQDQTQPTFSERKAKLRTRVSQARQALSYEFAVSGIEVDRDFDHLPFLISTLNEEQLEALRSMPGVLGVFQDRAYKANSKTLLEEESSAQPSLFFSRQDVNADEAWAQGASGQGQAVVILDTGVSASHPMFTNKIVAEACFSTSFLSSHTSLCPSGGSQQTGPGAGTYCPPGSLGICSHGSHVAGIAVGNDPNDPTDGRGIAKDADLIPIQVFTEVNSENICTNEDEPPEQECLVTYTSAHLAGLNHTIDLAETFDIAAVNMSFGGEPLTGTCNSTPIKSATDTLRDLGIAVVAAAGNDGEVGQMNDPACITGVVAVGSVVITSPASFTNVSELTDLMAPGFAIKSARVGSGYQFASGTSMSAPHVAGAFAILKSANPNATVDDMEHALEDGGPATAISGASYTVPRLDIAAGLALLDSEGPAPQAPVAATVVLNVASSLSLGPESHVRIFNPTTSSGSVVVDVRDSASGESLGLWTSGIIGPSGSPQIAISDIEQAMTPDFSPSPAIPFYTLLLTADFEGYVQHVSWDPVAGFITNHTGCNTAMITRPLDLLNVHSTQIPDYPSSIVIFNGGSAATAVQMTIHDSDGGELLANWTSPDIESSASRSFTMASIQDSALLLPASSLKQYTLRLDSIFDGFAQHFVNNTLTNITVNMTDACALTTE